MKITMAVSHITLIQVTSLMPWYDLRGIVDRKQSGGTFITSIRVLPLSINSIEI